MEQLPRVVPLAARVDGIYYSADEESELQLEALASRHQYAVTKRCVYAIKHATLPQYRQTPKHGITSL